MEKKDWKEDFHNRFVQHYAEDDIYNFYGYGDDAPQMGSGKEDVDDVIAFIEQEIDRAREEGYTKGVQDGMKGKVFEKIEIDTEVRFSDLKDVIDGKEDAGEFLDKLTK